MPLPGFVSDETLQTAFENLLKVAPGTFSSGDSSYVLDQIHAANVAAYQEIQAALIHRGLTQAQLDLWDRGAELQRSIGLYWCLVNLASVHSLGVDELKLYDRRAELRTIQLSLAGVPYKLQTPPGQEGQVSFGALDTSNDLFVLDPYDVRRGQITRW